jgi:hypothetical protein
MPQRDYNRYSILVNSNGTTDLMPFVVLPVNQSDKYINWNTEFNRLDKLSQTYYNNPFYDFLILYANGYMSEFDIPDGQLIRIPFPLSKVKNDYEAALTSYRNQ